MEAARAGRKIRIASPCRVCGCKLRYTSSNQCVPCTKDRAREYEDSIREELKKNADG